MAGGFLPKSCQVRVGGVAFKYVAIRFPVGREQVWVGHQVFPMETQAAKKDRQNDGVFHEMIS